MRRSIAEALLRPSGPLRGRMGAERRVDRSTEVEGELPDMNAEEMAQESFYLLKSLSDTATAKGGVS